MVCLVLVVGISSKASLKESCEVWYLLSLMDVLPLHHFEVTEKKKNLFYSVFQLLCCHFRVFLLACK